MAAQKQALYSKAIASSVYHTTDDQMCWLCGNKQENVTHVNSGYKMHAEGERVQKIT